MIQQRPIILITLVVFIDLLAFSMTLPVIPYYAEQFGANASLVGILSALYAFAQFFSTPMIGRWSDSVGRRKALILCMTGSIIAYVWIGFAQALWMIVVGKIIGGILGATVPLAYTYTSDCSDESNRTQSMGYLGAAFGAAFTIGPAIGGILSKLSYAWPIRLSLGFACLNLVIVWLFLREPQIHRQTHTTTIIETIHALRDAVYHPPLRFLFFQWFLFSMAFATFQSNIGLFNQYHLHLTAQQSSIVFATIGILVTVVQAGCVGWLTKVVREQTLTVFCCVLFMVMLFVWAYSWSLEFLLILLIPLCFAASMLITLTNSTLSTYSNGQNTGSIMGAAAGLDNITRAVTALGGGFLIQYYGTSAPGIVAGCIMIGATAISYYRRQSM